MDEITITLNPYRYLAGQKRYIVRKGLITANCDTIKEGEALKKELAHISINPVSLAYLMVHKEAGV